MTESISIDLEPVPSLREVLESHDFDVEDGGVGQAVYEGLLIREDLMAEHLRVAGLMFGAHPPIVAEALATIGIGTPLGEEQRAFIRTQFINHIEALRRAYEEEQRRRQQGEG